MSILGPIGAAAGYYLGGPTGAIIGAKIGGDIDTNQTRRDIADSANEFSANMYRSRYQMQVEDMKAAGLNPMLAYMQAPGPSPTGQQAQVSNPYENLDRAYSSASNVERQGSLLEEQTNVARAERWLKDAQTTLAQTSADQGRAVIGKLEVEAKKISEEIKNIPLEGDRLIALAKNLKASTQLIYAQAGTEVERQAQVKWLALKTMLESDLLQYDVKAAEQAENFGREFGQYKPFVDTLLSLIRTFVRR